MQKLNSNELQTAIQTLIGGVQRGKEGSKYYDMCTYYIRRLLEVQVVLADNMLVKAGKVVKEPKVRVPTAKDKAKMAAINTELAELIEQNKKK